MGAPDPCTPSMGVHHIRAPLGPQPKNMKNSRRPHPTLTLRSPSARASSLARFPLLPLPSPRPPPRPRSALLAALHSPPPHPSPPPSHHPPRTRPRPTLKLDSAPHPLPSRPLALPFAAPTFSACSPPDLADKTTQSRVSERLMERRRQSMQTGAAFAL